MSKGELKKVIIPIAIALLLLAGFLWFLWQKTHNGLGASGTIEATEVVVSSKVPGRVTQLLVDEGKQVKEGELLAKIETTEVFASLRSSQARFNVARDDFSRARDLFRERLISPQQYEGARSAMEVAASALEIAKSQYENAEIKAPISGVVLVKAIEIGELASPGTPIVTLADLGEVKLTVYLAEKEVGKAKLGQEVMVSVDSYPKEKFKGQIVYISDKAEFTPKAIQTKSERVTQVFGVKIKIANPDFKLKPGMPADAQFSANGG